VRSAWCAVDRILNECLYLVFDSLVRILTPNATRRSPVVCLSRIQQKTASRTLARVYTTYNTKNPNMQLSDDVKKILLRPAEDPTRGYICTVKPNEIHGPVLFNGKTFRRSHLTVEFHAAKMAACLGVELMDVSVDAKNPCGADARMIEVDSKRMLDVRSRGAPIPYLMICDNVDLNRPATKEATECRKTPDLVLGHKDADPFLKACLYQFGTMSLEDIMRDLNLYFATDGIRDAHPLAGTFIGVIHFIVDKNTSFETRVRLVLGHGRMVGIYKTYLLARNQIGYPLKFSPVHLMEALKASPTRSIDLCRPNQPDVVSGAPAADPRELMDWRDIKIVLTALCILGSVTGGVDKTMTIAPETPGHKTKFTIERISLSMGAPDKPFDRILGFVWADSTLVKKKKEHVAVMIRKGLGDVQIGYMAEPEAKIGRARLAFSDSETRRVMFTRVMSDLTPVEVLGYAADWVSRLQDVDFDEQHAKKLGDSFKGFVGPLRMYKKELVKNEDYMAKLTDVCAQFGKRLRATGKPHAIELAKLVDTTVADELSKALVPPAVVSALASAAAEAEAAALAETQKVDDNKDDGDVPMTPVTDDDDGENNKKEEVAPTSAPAPSAALGVAPDSKAMSLSPAVRASVVAAAAVIASEKEPVFVPPPRPSSPSVSASPKRKAESQSQDMTSAEKLLDEIMHQPSPAKRPRTGGVAAGGGGGGGGDSVIDLTTSVTGEQKKTSTEPICRICAKPDPDAVFVCNKCGSTMTHGGGMPDDMAQLKYMINKLLAGQERMEAELKRIRESSSSKMDES
jgi:hypothetical protein